MNKIIFCLFFVFLIASSVIALEGNSSNYKANFYFGGGGTHNGTITGKTVSEGIGQVFIGNILGSIYNLLKGIYYILTLALAGPELVWEIDVTEPDLAGADYIWLDNIAKNESNITSLVTESLIAYYDLNEDAIDQMGNYDGTITNATNTTGHLGVNNSAMGFDGDDNVNVGDVIELNSVEYFTVSYWFKKADDEARTTFFKSKDSDERLVIYNTASSGTDRLYFYVENISTSYAWITSYSTVVPKDEWHHQLWIYDGTGSDNATRLKLYIDGVQKTLSFTGTIPTMTADLSAKDLTLGTTFNGSIDNVRIYNRTLSAEEVKALYQERNDNHTNGSFTVAFCIKDCINETGLIGQWELNWDAEDRVAGENNGTFVNGVINATKCRYKECMSFDGNNSYINIGDKIVDGLESLTVAAWFKADNISSGAACKHYNDYQNAIVSKSGDSGDNNLMLSVCSKDKLYFYVDAVTEGEMATTNSPINLGEWYFAVGVKDSDTSAKLYLNGVLQATDTTVGLTLVNNNIPLRIGDGEYAAKNQAFNGSIDNVMLWNRSLLPQEIYKLYLSGYEHHLPDASLKKIEYDGDGAGSCTLSDIDDDCDTRAVSHWKLDKDAVDCVEGKYNGTIINVTNTTGFFGNAMEFDGDNDYVNTADINSINNASHTISLWVKRDGDNLRDVLIGKRGTTTYEFTFYLSGTAYGNVEYISYTAAGGNHITFDTTGNTVPIGEWHHITYVADYESNNFRIYVDGIEEGHTSTVSGSMVDRSADITIGSAYVAGANRYLNGSMDDVRIYNRSLSAYEIWELYHARFNTSRISYADGELINSSSDYGICELDATYFTYFNLSFTWDTDLAPVVNLISPADNYVNNTQQHVNITFSAGVSDDYNLKNCSLWHNISGTWSLNQSEAVTGTSNTTSFWLNLTNTSFIWNIECYDNNSQVGWGINRTVTLNWTNRAPTQGIPILNSTNGTNLTSENLTVYNISTYDADGDSVKNIINWYKDGTSIMVLNMPFEGWNNGTHDENNWTKDYSSFGNNGTVINGTTWNSSGGYDGKGAYDFDGVNDYVDCGNHSSLNFGSSTDFTLMAWVKVPSGSSGNGDIISRKPGNWYSLGGYNLYFTSSTVGYARLRDSVGGDGYAEFTITEDEWYHIVGVFNRSGNLSTYVNGVMENTVDISSIGNIDINALVKIGGESRGFFNGLIDEVRIYNHSLSAEQIQALYNNRTDLIVSQETSAGDVWQACITPNDGTEDGDMECSNNLTILAAPVEITINITKTFDPDVIVAGLSENINVTTTVWINETTNNITYFNIIDEVPYDFTPPSASNVFVTYINGSDNSRIIITDNVTINITDMVGTNNTIITVNGTNNSLGFYLFNDSIELNYLMVTSIMSANETRAANVNATANDTEVNKGTGYLAINITASQAVLRGYKQITYNQSSPGNFIVNIDIKALGGDLTAILAADYLPDAIDGISDLLNFNISYYNSSSGNYTHLINEHDYNITGPWTGTLPGGYPASIFHYNLSYNFTNWDGTIYENDSIHINYSVTVLGGGNWTLPCIIGGWDPQYKKHIKTEITAKHQVPLFDVEVNVLTKKIEAGDYVRAMLNMLNIGGPKAMVDVFLTYSIKTMDGELIDEKSKTFAVLEGKENELTIQTQPDITPGTYTFEVLVSYTGREAMSTDTFKVIGEEEFSFAKNIQLIFTIMTAVLVIIFVIIRTRKKPKEEVPKQNF